MLAVAPANGMSASVVVAAEPEMIESLAYGGVVVAPIATVSDVVASFTVPMLLVVQPPPVDAPPTDTAPQRTLPTLSVLRALPPLQLLNQRLSPVVNFPLTAVRRPEVYRLVVVAPVATRFVVLKLVEVALVVVARVKMLPTPVRFVIVPLVATRFVLNRLVVVACVPVAFTKVKFWKLD